MTLNPKTMCVVLVSAHGGVGSLPCMNPGKVLDPAGWHCGIHSDAAYAKRRAKSNTLYAAHSAAFDLAASIAAGRKECVEMLAKFLRTHDRNDQSFWTKEWFERAQKAVEKAEGKVQNSEGLAKS